MESVGTKKRQSFEGGCLLNSFGRYGEGCCYDVYCIEICKKYFYTLGVTPKGVSPLIFKAFLDRIRFEKLVEKGSFLFDYFLYRVIDKMLSIINYEF